MYNVSRNNTRLPFISKVTMLKLLIVFNCHKITIFHFHVSVGRTRPVTVYALAMEDIRDLMVTTVQDLMVITILDQVFTTIQDQCLTTKDLEGTANAARTKIMFAQTVVKPTIMHVRRSASKLPLSFFF